MDRRRADLEARLDRYLPADDDECRSRDRLLALLQDARDPFDRASFDPGHVTASAFVLDPERSAVLLIRHATLGRWLQPGGHVEPLDPTIERAARREVFEEVGIAWPDGADCGGAPFDLDVHRIPARDGNPEHLHHDVRFLFVSPSREVRETPEAPQVIWVPVLELAWHQDSDSFRRVARKLAAATAF